MNIEREIRQQIQADIKTLLNEMQNHSDYNVDKRLKSWQIIHTCVLTLQELEKE